MILENATTSNREALINEFENLQSQIPTNNHYIGELYGGGVIASIYEYFGQKSALIVGLEDAADYVITYSNISSVTFSKADSFTDGFTNSKNIKDTAGFTNGAAKIAMSYTGGGFNDWYLPSLGEFMDILKNVFIINKVLETEGLPLGFEVIPGYWTSTESIEQANKACAIDNSGTNYFVEVLTFKTNEYKVRAVRKIDL